AVRATGVVRIRRRRSDRRLGQARQHAGDGQPDARRRTAGENVTTRDSHTETPPWAVVTWSLYREAAWKSQLKHWETAGYRRACKRPCSSRIRTSRLFATIW